MKTAVIFLLFSISLVFSNSATSSILNARANYIECDVDYAKDWIFMREDCAKDSDVDVFDSSEFVNEYDNLMDELYDNADDAHELTFTITVLEIGGNTLKLIGKVVEDAFDNKNGKFFQCVREEEEPLKEIQKACREKALAVEGEATEDYLEEELDLANDEIEKLQEKGIDTSDMEEIVEYGVDLKSDIKSAYSSNDIIEVRKIHARHSRLVFLFRANQVLATINYMEPIIENGKNDNKEEILERGNDLRTDMTDLVKECAYSEDVSDIVNYGKQNAECWESGIDLYGEFLDLGDLILRGI